MNSRKRLEKLYLMMFCCTICNCLIAQDIESPRFFTLNFQSFSPAQQIISQDGKVVAPSDEELGFLLSSKLLFPISLHGKTKLIGAVEYGREFIQGIHDLTEREDEFLHFNKIGLSLIAKHKINETFSYCASFKLKNGAEKLFPLDGSAFSLNTAHILEKKVENGKIGLGIQIGYNQRISLLPIIKYKKELGNNWKADILLPSQALFYKKLNDTKRLYLGMKGSRASYLLNQTESIDADALYYRRLTANIMVGYEKQLKGPLGFMIEAGISVPVRSGLFALDTRWKEVHAYQENTNPYVKAGIFLAIDK